MKTIIVVIIFATIMINGMKNAKEFMMETRVAHAQQIELAVNGH